MAIADDRWNKKKGVAEAQWIKATVWGDRADRLVKFLKKGTMVTVVGSLIIDISERDGKYTTFIRVQVEDLKFMVAPQNPGRPAKPPIDQSLHDADVVPFTAEAYEGSDGGDSTFGDDDIPF